MTDVLATIHNPPNLMNGDTMVLTFVAVGETLLPINWRVRREDDWTDWGGIEWR